MTDKLLPCPFCGGKAGYGRGGADFSRHGWNAGCVNGHAVSPDMETKAEAREWWNRRPKPRRSPSPQSREATPQSDALPSPQQREESR